jgi:hypothetical protein
MYGTPLIVLYGTAEPPGLSLAFFKICFTTYNYLFDKKKGKLFFTGFFLTREQKNSGKKFFLFIGHEVLFYETPFLHGAIRIYFCGATTLARPVVAGRVLNFGT